MLVMLLLLQIDRKNAKTALAALQYSGAVPAFQLNKSVNIQ
jgi:hypothetical protein